MRSSPHEAETTPIANTTILLVDDSRLLRLGNERALVRAGYRVISVGDGEEGLRVAREGGIDLMLLDMMLPKISGLDVLRALKRDPSTAQIPVLVLTGLSQSNEAKLLEEGASGFFQKSERMLDNDGEALVGAVKRVLARAKKAAAAAKS
jgi:DNA-binding response OmpR family regulator